MSRKAFIACILILAMSIAACLLVGAFGALKSSGTAIVHAGDGMEYSFDLGVDAQQTIQTDLGSNQVTVHDGCISVTWADCPHQDCVQQGAISQAGQQIVCLPHKLWIEVSSGQVGAADVTSR